jgi:hypothetical protein
MLVEPATVIGCSMAFIPEFEVTERQVIYDPDVVDRIVRTVFASPVGA